MRKFLITCLLTFSCYAEIPEPYNSIEDLPFDGDGWFANPVYLEACFLEKPDIKTVIEVGSWLGASTRFIANLLPEAGKLYAVDTWLGSWTPNQYMYFQNDPRVNYAYQLFLSNVKHAGLTHKIIPVRMASLEAASGIKVKADLIYIDACHEEESVYADVLAWYPHLNEGGIMCGDDWMWESVQRGVTRAAAVLGKQIAADANFWKFL